MVVRVQAALYNAVNNSVTLRLGRFNSNKPLTLTATGLVGVTGRTSSHDRDQALIPQLRSCSSPEGSELKALAARISGLATPVVVRPSTKPVFVRRETSRPRGLLLLWS